jgi:tetratricopeptide (TPR) repeat protein
LPLAALADRLKSDDGRRTMLGSSDPATNVWSVFSWSYETLSPAAARLFRLLGMHPGPHLGATAAASLAAMPANRIEPLLAELVSAHLLTEPVPGRYAFHDLLRAFATELVQKVDVPMERAAATQRLLDHYLHSAFAADRLLNPHRPAIALDAVAPGVAPDTFAGLPQALAWFAGEHPVLVASVAEAERAGLDSHTRQLAWCLVNHLDRHGHWPEWVAVQRRALNAVACSADKRVRGHTHSGLAAALERLLDYTGATNHYRRALDLAGDVGDAYGEGQSLLSLARVSYRLDRHRDAIELAKRALERYRVAGDRPGEANALNAIGWCESLLGEHRPALENCIQALAVQDELDDKPAQAHTLDSLGHIYHHLGDHDRAVSCCRRAADLFADLGDSYNRAEALIHLGDAYDGTNAHMAAQSAWQEAMGLLEQLGHPTAETLRRKLDAAAGTAGAP